MLHIIFDLEKNNGYTVFNIIFFNMSSESGKTSLYIHGIDNTITKHDVISELEKIGRISDSRKIPHKPYMFVEMESEKGAKKVVKESEESGIYVKGKKLTIEFAKSSKSRHSSERPSSSRKRDRYTYSDDYSDSYDYYSRNHHSSRSRHSRSPLRHRRSHSYYSDYEDDIPRRFRDEYSSHRRHGSPSHYRH